jgi:hypothetical protein
MKRQTPRSAVSPTSPTPRPLRLCGEIFSRTHLPDPPAIGSASNQSPPIPPRQLHAYQRTIYRAAGSVIRIGHRPPEPLFHRLRLRTAVFITAWNPMSRRMPNGWNQRMQQQLQQHLRRHVTLIAEGALQRWREEHLLVAGDPRPMLRIARRFRQRGVVVIQRRRPARLVLLVTDQAW